MATWAYEGRVDLTVSAPFVVSGRKAGAPTVRPFYFRALDVFLENQ